MAFVFKQVFYSTFGQDMRMEKYTLCLVLVASNGLTCRCICRIMSSTKRGALSREGQVH